MRCSVHGTELNTAGICQRCENAGDNVWYFGNTCPEPEAPTQLDRVEAMLTEITAHMKDTTEYRLLHPEIFPVPEHGTGQ